MQKSNIWINFSIFYSHRSLDLLVRKALRPFVRQVKADKMASACILQLGRYFTEHLKVFLLTDLNHVHGIETYINLYILSFIKETPSKCPPVKLPLDTIFLPFPNNSIQYNINSELYSFYLHPKEQKIRDSISNSMLVALGEEPYDEDLKFSFFLYMQLIYLNSYSESDKRCLIECLYKKNFSSLSPNIRSEVNSYIKRLTDMNRNVFTSIVEDIDRSLDNAEDGWIAQWFQECNLLVEAGTALEDNFILLVRCLHGQLDVINYRQSLAALSILKELYGTLEEIKPLN